MKKIIKFVLNSFYVLLVVALIVFGAVVALSVFGKPGNYQLFVVQSGSMDPSLKKGSVVLIEPTDRVKKILSPLPTATFNKGDIITYSSGGYHITHRVVGVEDSGGGFVYETKGDANKTSDVKKVTEGKVLGKTILSVPYLGHAISFAKTQMGYIFLIVVPSTVIIYSEILNIEKEFRRIVADRRKRRMAI